MVGNLAAGTTSRSLLPGDEIYEPLANFQICAWDDNSEQLAEPCPDALIQDNTAAGSGHIGFLLQVSV